MQIFGLNISRQKAATNLQPVSDRGGWWPIIKESFAGAWQQNVEVKHDSVMAYSPVFSCITLISSDFGKLRIKLSQVMPSGVWKETTSASFSPVLRKPNRYQNHIQFK